MSYYPKRPIKSFQDLEVYHKALAICVVVVKRSAAEVATAVAEASYKTDIIKKLHETLLTLPVFIATAHSLRFADQEKAISILEDVMLKCNLAVVYLDQYRDIYNKDIEIQFFEEQIKNLLSLRMKILHLQRSWKKFTPLETNKSLKRGLVSNGVNPKI